MSGNIPVFRISEVSLVDIDQLIDIGKRFQLKENLGENEQFDDVARYIEDGKSRARLCSCSKRC